MTRPAGTPGSRGAAHALATAADEALAAPLPGLAVISG
jgi:hypothetical protein